MGRAATLQVGWVLLTGLLASCVYPRTEAPLARSEAFDRPEETDMGRRAVPGLAAHEGKCALVLLRTGLDAFAARVAVIDRTERALDVQYYIFHDDVTGRWLLSRMLAAADRGVRVRLLLDDMGAGEIDDLIAAADVHENLEVRLFNPFARGPWPGLARKLDMIGRMRRLNHRMHNKLLAGDGSAAIVGGRNVGDEYFDAHEHVNFADLDLLAVGPVLPQLGESFDLYWNSPFVVSLSAWKSFRRGSEDLDALREELQAHVTEHADSVYGERLRGTEFVRELLAGELDPFWASAQAVADLPEKIVARGDEVSRTLLRVRAEEYWPESTRELTIVSPYFVPRKAGVEHLCELVAQGVRVRVLTNSLAATDVPAVHAGYKGSRRALLNGGVELHELRPSSATLSESHRRGMFGSRSASLHAKTFISDRQRVFVGSMNLDPRSANLNTELGLVVDSAELAGDLLRRFEKVTQPGLCWRLELDDGDLVWVGEREGVPVRLTKEPDTSWFSRCKVTFLGWLPIEGQL